MTRSPIELSWTAKNTLSFGPNGGEASAQIDFDTFWNVIIVCKGGDPLPKLIITLITHFIQIVWVAKYPKILWIIYCQVAPGPLIWGYAAYPCSPRLCTCTLCVVSVCNWPTVPRPTVLPCLRLAKGLKTSDVAANELGLQKAAQTIMPVVLTLDARYMAPVIYIQVRWE